MHDKAVPINFCFEIKKIYKEDCLLGNMLCEQKCNEELISYSGKIFVNEEPSKAEGFGSATSLGVSVPLKLTVKCKPSARDWTLGYSILVVVSLLLIILILQRRKQRR